MGKILTEDQKALLNLDFTDAEIKNALFSIESEKAPGIDGFGSLFT